MSHQILEARVMIRVVCLISAIQMVEGKRLGPALFAPFERLLKGVN